MARSTQQAAVAGELTAEEQAQLDQMRNDDAQPIEPAPSEPAPSEPTPPAEEPAADEGSPPDDRPRMVPHAALHEERERRKEIERQAAENAKRWEERFNTVLQRVGQPQPAPQPPAPTPPPAIPEVDKDPVGHIVGRIAQHEQALGAVVQMLQGIGQQNQQQLAVSQVTQRAIALEQQFATATPDYVQAVAHLADQRHRELEIAGWSDPAERQQIISREAVTLASQAIQQGRNPAEMVYNLAKLRGFQAPTPEPAAAPDATQRLEQVNRGQQQNARTLGNVRGSGPAPLNANSLLQMSDDEFNKMMETKEGRDLLGV